MQCTRHKIKPKPSKYVMLEIVLLQLAKYVLMLKIHEIFEDSNQIFGAEKIRAMLACEGIHVSYKRISAFLREMGMESVRVDAKKQ